MSCEWVGVARRIARALRDAAQGAFEALWGWGFAVLGAAREPAVQRLAFGGGQSILVVAPHPDDEVAGCGGTIARHIAAGDHVTVAWVTDGRRSTALSLPPDETAAARRGEAEAASAALQVGKTVWIGLREGEWRPAELVPRLLELLRENAPTIVYAPSRIDFHPEHRAVAHALARALAGFDEAREPLAVRLFQVQVPLGAPLVNRVADVSTWCSAAHDAALTRYTSQRGALARCKRMKRYAARAHGGGSLAEEFRDMSMEDYLRLHLPPVETWRERFRGLRYLAVADPAAYLVGRGARRRLVN